MTQEVSYSQINGVDFGAKGRVLIRNARSALIWFPGASYYANFMEGTKYGGATMQIVRNSTSASNCYTPVHRDGGRLSLKIVLDHAEQIDKEFGVGAHAKIRIKETYVMPPGTADEPWFRLVPPAYLEEEARSKAAGRAERLRRKEQDRKVRQLPREKPFTDDELEFLTYHFNLANDPIAQTIREKAEIMLQHRRV